MADDVSAGELDRRLEAHERRTDRIHGELDSRITNLAKDTVPLLVYQQGERDRDREVQSLKDEHVNDVRQIRDELRELRERPSMTVGRWAVVGSAMIALLALIVQAYGTLKGAK